MNSHTQGPHYIAFEHSIEIAALLINNTNFKKNTLKNGRLHSTMHKYVCIGNEEPAQAVFRS